LYKAAPDLSIKRFSEFQRDLSGFLPEEFAEALRMSKAQPVGDFIYSKVRSGPRPHRFEIVRMENRTEA